MELNAEITIPTIVEAMLPVGSSVLPEQIELTLLPPCCRPSPPRARALYLHLDCRSHVYDDEGDLCASCEVHLIFERSSSYTKVWSAINRNWMIPAADKFELSSEHDSCWRTDGLRSLERARDMMRKELKAEGWPQQGETRRMSVCNAPHRLCYVQVTYGHRQAGNRPLLSIEREDERK